MPILLDANAVLRYLLEDQPDQANEVEQAISQGAEVTLEVLAECVYVLSGVYGVSRSGIAESLCILLDEVGCQRFNTAVSAIGLYRGSTMDFVDCILAAEHEKGREVLTFDKKLLCLMKKLD